MKITDMTVERYAWPRPKPISNGKYTYVDVSLNLVHIYTDEGVTGVGWGGGTASGQGSDLTTTLIDYFKPDWEGCGAACLPAAGGVPGQHSGIHCGRLL